MLIQKAKMEEMFLVPPIVTKEVQLLYSFVSVEFSNIGSITVNPVNLSNALLCVSFIESLADVFKTHSLKQFLTINLGN